MTERAALNPKQQEILDDLLGQRDRSARPEFRVDLAVELHEHIEAGLADHVPGDPHDPSLAVTKYAVSGVMGCEARWLADREFDGWSVDMLVGTVVHRAIEHHCLAGVDLAPLALVEHVLAWMGEQDKPGGVAAFLADLDLAERVDLVNAANNGYSAFVDHWPPIDRAWRPRFEQWSGYDRLLGGTVELRAKHDLAFGTPQGTTARTIIVDVKTGRPAPAHAGELRFYALVETLRARVPPFRVASYYTRSGTWHAQDVTEDLLFRTADSLVDAIRRIWAITTGAREPRRVPSGLCEHHCDLLPECDEGRAHVAERAG